MANVVQAFALRRDTSTNWTTRDPVLLDGQEGYEVDTRKRKVGNGISKWSQLQYDVSDGGGGGTGGGAPIAGLRYLFIYNGVDYVGPDGVVATPTNSTAEARVAAGYPGTYRDYGPPGSPDANALGLMIDHDRMAVSTV